MCRGHNGYLAEVDYGKEAIERHRRSAHRVSEPEVTYTIDWSRIRPDRVALPNSVNDPRMDSVDAGSP